MNKLLKLTLLAVSLFASQATASKNSSDINSVIKSYKPDHISTYDKDLKAMMNKNPGIKYKVNMISKAEKYLGDVETNVDSNKQDAFRLFESVASREEKLALLQNISSNLNSLKEEMTSVSDNVINTCDPRTTKHNGQVLYIEGKGVMSGNYLSYTNKYNNFIALSVKCKEIIDITLEYLENVKNICVKYMPLDNTGNQPQAERPEDYVDEIN